MNTSAVTARDVWPRRDAVQLLDVREPDEWDAGHIPGAVHIPMYQLQARQREIATDRTVVCVCRSGNRSAVVTQALVRAGYDAVNLEGGVYAWVAAGLPFESSDGHPPRVA